MAAAQTIWGIDLGRCALKALKLRAGSEGKVEVLAADYVEHAKILSQPDADRHALIGAALEKFLSRNDISKDQVVVSVPGQHALARFSKLPPSAPKLIPRVVRYEADQQIPFDMDEIIWDYQTFQEEGSPDLEVGIFAMKRELIREHLLHFEQASIEPIVLQSSPLAVYNAAHFDGLIGDQTAILLDVGAETTDVIIATKENLWTRTIQIGGNNYTEALVKSFKLSFSKAENLKRTAVSSKYARQVFQVMRPIFADLVQELQRSIGFYSKTHRDARFEKIVGVGNAFKLPGLQKYLQQNLGLTVEQPTSFARLAPSEGVDLESFEAELPSFAVAYGLALQGLELSKVATNLLPVEIAKLAAWRKKRPAFAAAAACLVLSGGLIWLRLSADTSALAAASAGAVDVRVSDVEEAARVIDNGPRPGSGRARAKQILQAGQAMKRALQDLRGQGEDEHAEAAELIRIQGSKTLVPKIFQVIHESVPVPKGPLGQATTQEEMLAAIETGDAGPRNERRQVFIDELRMDFEPDVNSVEWINLVDAEEPINDPEAEDLLPGFKIEIRCRTPHKGGMKFISESFMNALRKNGRRPGTGFYFDRVFLYSGGRVVSTSDRSTSSTRRSSTRRVLPGTGGKGGFPGGRSWGGTRRGAPAPAPVVTTAAEDLDPVTLEPIENDWEFTIWIDAICEDYPEPEAQEDDDAGAEGGG